MENNQLDLQQINYQRKLALADALRKQSMQGSPTQSIDGVAIRNSPMEGLARLFQAYQSSKMNKGANSDFTKYQDQQQNAHSQDVSNMLGKLLGTPENAPTDGMGPTMPAQAPNQQEALAAALQSKFPDIQGMGNGMMSGMMKRPDPYTLTPGQTRFGGDNQQVASVPIAPKPAEGFTLSPGAQRFGADGQPIASVPANAPAPNFNQPFGSDGKPNVAFQNYQRSLKPPAAPDGSGKPPAGYRFTRTGDLQAIPGGPADLKEQQKATVQETGRSNVSATIGTLRDAYRQLQESGGITDPNGGTLGNLAAGIESSGIGQATGKMFGTQNQSQRNQILMTRPALLQHIMHATGMSAKQMDSNAELKLWLSTATDPSVDINANMKALDNIERVYGIGGAQQAVPSNPDEPPPGAVRRVK